MHPNQQRRFLGVLSTKVPKSQVQTLHCASCNIPALRIGNPELPEQAEDSKSNGSHADRILLLLKKNIEERNFGDWSMGFVDLEQSSNRLSGFVKLMEAHSSFLDLQGDAEMVAKLIDGFQQGRWRQRVS